MSTKRNQIRVLLAKPGLDTHERGVKLLVSKLSEAGMDVVYLGGFQSAADIVDAAREASPDVIGLSYLDGGHHAITQRIIDVLAENGLATIPIVCGGVIPDEDSRSLLDIGVKGCLRAWHLNGNHRGRNP